MSRVLEGVIAGGALAGLAWYVLRERDKHDASVRAAERIAELATERAAAADAGARDVRAEAERAAAAAQQLAALRAELAQGNRPAPAPVATSPAPTTPTASAVPVAPTSAPSTPPTPPVPSAPIASPPINQTPPPLALPPARPGLTRRFDDLFRTHGQGIPVAYLRALANAESSMRADDRLGLINVVKVALDDYNRRRRMAITPEQMRDPAINVRVAADTLRMIIDSYRVNHADVDNLREDWRNPRFVELLTTGWNAGYSEIGGVGRVVRWLQQRPIAERAPITIDAVFDAAWSAGATRHLSNPRKLTWAKGVAKAYERERERDQRDRIA